ncbi:type III secretion system outer membrane ring subunit SctC [Ideonella sp. DXS29W]|uniref:Type 3 secretion system secretin n=1 Tax=Ideonella lacteola TaxID=2984193 RepID=A0ABU9BHY0_9BURK
MPAMPRRCPPAVLALLAGLTVAMSPSPVSGARSAGADSADAAGQELPMASQRFVYKADGKRLSDVLNDFAASQGVPVVVDPRVEGVVSGNFDTTPRQFLEGLSKAYALLWYFDGTAFYFYPAGAIQSRIFRLKGYRREQVVQMLDSLKLSSRRYPIRFDSANSTLLVYGPPRHVELVGLAIESLDIGAIEGNRRVAKVFPLRFASAGDRQLGDAVVPGIASTLQAVYGGAGRSQSPSSALSNAQRESSRTLAPLNKAMQAISGSADLKGRYLPDLSRSPAAGGTALADDKTGAVPTPRSVRSPLLDDLDDDVPVFEPDEGSNSVIVYSKARRMSEFAALIKTLDVQPILVELEATVIDVSADNLSELGVDWSLQGSRGALTMTGPAQAPSQDPSTVNATPFTINTLVRDAGRALLANVRVLEGNGHARIVSKPRVLGLANRPATMSEKRIANVRVAGNLEANLFQVEAGTMLQVTPQVGTAVPGQPTPIKLSIYIQDGSFQDVVVDHVPVLKKTEIRTEARVVEGESLLIGGITVDSVQSGVSGVPLLKDIPVIGGLFRQSRDRTARAERMFLLTPRVITPQPTLADAATSSPRPRVDLGGQPPQGALPAVSPRVAPAPALPAASAAPAAVPPSAKPMSAEDEHLSPLLSRIAQKPAVGSAPSTVGAANPARSSSRTGVRRP